MLYSREEKELGCWAMFSSSSGEIVEKAWTLQQWECRDLTQGKTLFKDQEDRCREGSVKTPGGSVHGQMLPEVFLLSPAPAAGT